MVSQSDDQSKPSGIDLDAPCTQAQFGWLVGISQQAVSNLAARGEHFGGVGLGLALVHTVIHRHGGTLEVDSDVGRGAEFRLVLPLGS